MAREEAPKNHVAGAPGRIGRRRLYLMRHGHVDYFAEGLTDFTQVPLTEEGKAQATAAGTALNNIRFDIARHSGLPRTEQTLALVLAENDAPPSLIEKANGMAELKGGVYVTEIREELAARLAYSFDVADQPDAAFLPGGEKFSDAYQRITQSFEDFVLGQPWRTALQVAHEGVNRILLSYFAGAGLSGVKAFEQDLGGINVIDIDVVPCEKVGMKIERFCLKSVNVTPYDMVKHGLPRSSLEHMFDIDFDGQRRTDF